MTDPQSLIRAAMRPKREYSLTDLQNRTSRVFTDQALKKALRQMVKARVLDSDHIADGASGCQTWRMREGA